MIDDDRWRLRRNGSSYRFPEFCELKRTIPEGKWDFFFRVAPALGPGSNDPGPTCVARVTSTLLQDGCGGGADADNTPHYLF